MYSGGRRFLCFFSVKTPGRNVERRPIKEARKTPHLEWERRPGAEALPNEPTDYFTSSAFTKSKPPSGRLWKFTSFFDEAEMSWSTERKTQGASFQMSFCASS